MEKIEYLHSFDGFDNPVCRMMEEANKGRNDIQPPVEPEIGRLLSFLVKASGAKKVLELGCGVGNSSIWLAQALKPAGGILYTVDNHPKTWKEAAANIAKAGLDGYVNMIFGNAEEVVKDLLASEEKFDLIFQDCGKYLYTLIYEDVVLLLKDNGIIAADDTMFKVCGGVRKNLGEYMDRYNKKIFSDKRFYSVMAPIGHGITLSIKI